jgi:hypothetical protein
MLGTIAYFGLQLWNDQRQQMNDLKTSITVLTNEIKSAAIQRDDRLTTLRTEMEANFKGVTLRVSALEGRQDTYERRSHDDAALLGALKEQSAATYNAVSKLQEYVQRHK